MEQALASKWFIRMKLFSQFLYSYMQVRVAAFPYLSCVRSLNREYYGSVEQLVTGRKNLTRPPLWISCLWPSFVIPNWVPYIQSLGRFWHVNGGLRAPKTHDYSPKCYRGQKTVPWDALLGRGGMTQTQHHRRLKCASQSGIMLMIKLPSGHQTVSTIIELFMDDMGSHYVGRRMKHVNTVKPFGTLLYWVVQ